jgi:hypothetical protein
LLITSADGSGELRRCIRAAQSHICIRLSISQYQWSTALFWRKITSHSSSSDCFRHRAVHISLSHSINCGMRWHRMVKYGFMMGKECDMPHIHGTLSASCSYFFHCDWVV